MCATAKGFGGSSSGKKGERQRPPPEASVDEAQQSQRQSSQTTTTAASEEAPFARGSNRKRNNQRLAAVFDAAATKREEEDVPVALLDKWGLPPPTVEDIFPRLDAPTASTLRSASSMGSDDDQQKQQQKQNTTLLLSDILNHALRDFHNSTSVNVTQWSRFFQEDGSEQQPQSQSAAAVAAASSGMHQGPTSGDAAVEIAGPSTDNNKMQLRLIHGSPPIVTIENFLSESECRDILQLAMENDDETKGQSSSSSSSPVYKLPQSATLSSSKALSTRTSTSWFCRYDSVPTFLAKAQHMLGMDVACMEEPQIVRYQPGQEFSWHYDILPLPPQSSSSSSSSIEQGGGQRLATLLVYLNSLPLEAGGGTVFRDLRANYKDNNAAPTSTSTNDDECLSVKPVRGTALLFFPANAKGQADERTLHKGAVVLPPLANAQESFSDAGQDTANNNNSFTTTTGSSNNKWILQAWIHERPYSALLPTSDNSQTSPETRAAVAQAGARLGLTHNANQDDSVQNTA